MLVRSDPFRGFDRLAEQVLGTVARPTPMPMEAWRAGEEFVVEFDLPGIDPSTIDLDVERNVLTVKAERRPSTGPDVELVAAERPYGMFSRQVILGDTLDTDRINATYRGGVLHLSIPVAERAKPRKIAVSTSSDDALTTSSQDQPAPSHDQPASQDQIPANA